MVHTILIADDSSIERKLAAGLLCRHFECKVLAATNGSEALSLIDREGAAAQDGSAAAHPSRAAVDLVVSDLQMPVMDGFELLTTIGSRYPSLPVIIMTSQGSEDVAVRALRSGAAGYIPKRRLRQDLVETVRSVLSANRKDRDTERVLDDVAECSFSLAIDNDPARLPAVISFLQDWTARFGLCDESNRARIGIALEEALLNGMIHGNLEVASELRHRDDGSFGRLIRQRRTEEPYRSRRLHVAIQLARETVSFGIRDEGPGFDVSSIPDPRDPGNLLKPSGRGLLLMASFMDRVDFNATGNEVTMTMTAAGSRRSEIGGRRSVKASNSADL
jgi:CheY-like chemotaxis protein/anti-sigma regulatory factor (Ser/Thr protein kinase)